MNETKKKFKFNIIDLIVLIVIVAAVAFVVIKLSGGGLFGKDESTYIVKYFCDEVPDFAAEVIYVGDGVVDEQKDTDLGEVTSVSLYPSRTYAQSADGEYKLAPKEHYNSVEVVTIVKGTDYDNGVIIDGSKYGVGHSLTIRVGKAKIYGRVSYIEKVGNTTSEE